MSSKPSTPSFSEKRNRRKADKLVRTAKNALATGRDKEAIPYLDRASELARNNPERLERTLLLTGETHRNLGDMEAARTCFRSVLKANPTCGRAWKYLSDITKLTADSDDIKNMVALLNRDAVLDFQKASRSVRTASAAQVRQKLYQTSVERWKPYEPYIQPLLSALGLHDSDRENS
ncbi:MAG: hypothetical protein CMO04_12650 [Thalassospira sp.]|uniref:tetratricopeptide repeat protein n=1 Tax=Thalassospira sp. TaxID=1912094 RepID=UPI000C5DAB8D|nr:tetratricopeptide repeat protein [Thalassospira sp.]MAL40723.1 hypothetical protein [Thalassospira sp.]|tara:strand:+ start:705 stop:1235 length:531 start_codon:yes stop_codon:yes gene_type:complete